MRVLAGGYGLRLPPNASPRPPFPASAPTRMPLTLQSSSPSVYRNMTFVNHQIVFRDVSHGNPITWAPLGQLHQIRDVLGRLIPSSVVLSVVRYQVPADITNKHDMPSSVASVYATHSGTWHSVTSFITRRYRNVQTSCTNCISYGTHIYRNMAVHHQLHQTYRNTLHQLHQFMGHVPKHGLP